MHRDVASNGAADPAASEPLPAGRSVVAVVGIDRYRSWPRLHNAVNDARGTRELFLRRGFDEIVPPLLDDAATGDALRRLVTDDLSRLTPTDSLVLFFAGHGHTVTSRFEGSQPVKTGYVVPVDGDGASGVVATWLRIDGWLSDVSRLPPRHILVILDACYSGVALGSVIRWRSTGELPGDSLSALQRRRSRRVITSALDDQRALDSGPLPGHSLFTGCLLEGLSWGLAQHGRAKATGSEIGRYVQDRVTGYPTSAQTPDFGTLEFDDRGELLVELADRAAPAQTVPAAAVAATTVPEVATARVTLLPGRAPGQTPSHLHPPGARSIRRLLIAAPVAALVAAAGAAWRWPSVPMETDRGTSTTAIPAAGSTTVAGLSPNTSDREIQNMPGAELRPLDRSSSTDLANPPLDAVKPPPDPVKPLPDRAAPSRRHPGPAPRDTGPVASNLAATDATATSPPADNNTSELAARLATAEREQTSGDAHVALTLTQTLVSTALREDAYRVMAMAHCRLHNIDAAQSVYDQASAPVRRRLSSYCARFGIKF